MTEGSSTSTSTTEPTTDSESETATTGPQPDCTAENGAPDDACDPSTPFCVAGECVDCAGANGDSSCEALDGASPVCSGGTCVECTENNAAACGGMTPVCDTEASSCVACSAHAECGDAACNFADGSCFSTDYILWVDKTADDCMVGDGSMEAPFCTVAEAFAKISEPDNLPAAWTVRIRVGTYIEPEHITPANSTIALLGDNGNALLRSTVDATAGLTTGENSTLYTGNIVLSLAHTSGLKCSASTVYFVDSQLRSNTQHGLESIDCTTYIKGSLISQNQKGGIASYGPGLTHIDNSYVTANGNLVSEFGGIRSAQGNELQVVFSSLIGNDGDQAASVQCIDGAGAEIRNSVVIGRTNNPSVDCMDSVISYSVVDGGDMQGDGNLLAMGSDVKLWFEDPIGGIFRVKPLVDDLPSPIAAVAMWMTGDVAVDYDGDARQASEGAMDFPGADVPAE
jgi:hypothetical protein